MNSAADGREEIRPAGAAIGLQSCQKRSLKGLRFPDDHLIGAAELAGAGIGDARAAVEMTELL